MAAASADDQVNIGSQVEPGLWVGGTAASNLAFTAGNGSKWSDPSLAPFLAEANDNTVDGNGNPIGNTPFTCEAGQVGCIDQNTPGYQYATGLYAINFEPDTPAGLPFLASMTVRAPAGTKFPSNPDDYVVVTNCGGVTNPVNGDQYVVCVGTPTVVKTVDASEGNAVTVTMPTSVPANDGAMLFIAGVHNPPEGSYPRLDYPVTTGTQPVFGYPNNGDGTQDFGAGNVNDGNSALDASQSRVQVSEQFGITMTATMRDAYGNGVQNEQVFIEPIRGAPTGSFSGGTTTQSDGTVSTQFIDTTAEVAQFAALDVTNRFVLAQQPTVVYTPGPPDAAHSRVTLAPTTVPADGKSSALVTVQLADQFGNPTIDPESCLGGRCSSQDNVNYVAKGGGDQIYLEPQLNAANAFTFVHGTISPVPGSGCVSSVLPNAGCTNTVVCLQQGSVGCDKYAGQAQFDISDTTAEQVCFDVEDFTTVGTPLPVNGCSTTQPAITFAAGAPDPAHSKIAVTPSTVPADGTSSAQVTVTVEDQNGNPVPGVGVSLAQNAGGHATINPVGGATTDVNGHAVFSITNTTEESDSFTASYTGCSPNLSASPPTYCTTPAQVTVGFTAGGANAIKSTAMASATSVLADGKASSTITVTLVDAGGNPVPNKNVSLTQPAGAHSVISTLTGTTGANGQAQFSVSDSTPESVTYTATDASDNVVVAQQPTVAFTPAPDVGKTTVTAAPTSVPADGKSTSTVTVTLLDSTGAPIAGKQVSLIQPGTDHSTITTLSGTTNGSGQAQFSVTDSTPENVTYGVIDVTDYPSGPALGPHASVTFTTPTSEAGQSKVSASPTKVLANTTGTTGTSTVTVTLISAGGTPLSGHTVSLAQSAGGHSVITAVNATTDVNGQAQFSVSDPDVESVTYTAIDQTASVAVNQTATVTFIPNEATLSTVTAASPTATADGGATPGGTDYVTVSLDPGQPVVGNQVSLSQPVGVSSQIAAVQIPDSASGCAVQAPAGTSDCNGQARFKLTDTALETVVFSASDTSTGVKLQQTASVTFLPPPPQVSSLSPTSGPVAGGTSVEITGTNLFVEGQTPTVKFGANPATNASCSSSTTCTATAPAASGAGQVEVVVTTVAGDSTPVTSGDDLYTYLAPLPSVSKISPTSGPTQGGTTVTVTGTNFGTLNNTTVHFGTAKVTPKTINASGTQLTVIAPAEVAGTVDITVTTPAGTSAMLTADQYTYTSSSLGGGSFGGPGSLGGGGTI